MVQIFQRKKFASSSERFEGQTALFNEAEACESDQAPLPPSKTGSYSKSRGKRRPLPEHLPRVEKVYDLEGEDLICSCGCELEEFGEVQSEQLDVIPAKVQVIKHRRKRYSCAFCQTVKTSPMQAQPLPKTNASPGMLAHVATAKYVDALPLYRQEEIFRRMGISMPRSTLARWMIAVSHLLKPLYSSLEDELLSSSSLHMDETTVQVLKGTGKKSTAKSYMWIRCRSGPKPIVLFTFNPSRSSAAAKKLLKGFRGSLLTDGYEAYSTVVSGDPGITHYCCWDHARRPFFEAAKDRSSDSLPAVGLSYIQALYSVERTLKGSSRQEIERARGLYSRSILKHFRCWADRIVDAVLPKSPTGKALNYLLKYWDRLTRYVNNGDVPISNCFAENSIRPFAIGRKNWMFSDTKVGADASALLYSLVETAKANDLDPYQYLRHAIAGMSSVQTTEDLKKLLP